MHLSYLAAVACAAVASSYAFETMLPTPVPVRSDIEVVYRATTPSYCPGCEASFTDSVPDAGVSWDCPNGDRWMFTVETPIVSDAVCNPIGFACAESGDCKFDRKGVLSFIDSGPGPCKIHYRWNNEIRYFEGSNAEEFDMAINVTCKSGLPSEKDCKSETVEFYNNTTDDNVVVMSWDVEFCCSKCAD